MSINEFISKIEGYRFRKSQVDWGLVSNTLRILDTVGYRLDMQVLDRMVNAIIYKKVLASKDGLVYNII
ncbi:MAG: hypothetical protein KJ725_20335 [Gammaproteobacteria bacterium]|nr:hypothetical protein [Gammaproteobacteria bacterium]